jgi:glutamate-1-semialdehyde aminotransferase
MGRVTAPPLISLLSSRASQAIAGHRPAIERAIHLALANRGSLIAPFHHMMLACPAASAEQVERLCARFEDVVAGGGFANLPA